MTKTSLRIDSELETILKDNPFRDPMLMTSWEKELSRLREGERGPCDLDYEFVLDEDREFFHTPHGRKKGLFGKSICTNVLPQPMTGHPQAPIWILLLNPGFCAKDYYDHINVSEKMRKCIVKAGGGEYTDKSFDKPGPEAKSKLEKRQNLILSDIRAENWPAPFYLLDESFKTGEESPSDGRRWWRRRLGLESGNGFFGHFDDADSRCQDIVGRCLFVLEAFPYHSSTFPTGMVEKWAERKTAYFKFWKRLVKYGFIHRHVVIRATGKGKGVLGTFLSKADFDSFLDSPNVHFVDNVQNAFITPGNISNSDSVKQAIDEVLGGD